jgi:hypothetical protein
MNFFGFRSKEVDEPVDQQKEIAVRFVKVATQDTCLSPECDELPGASGEFGSEGNPIPVNGAGGEVNYLNRLFLLNGERVFFHRVGTVMSPLATMPLDRFEVVATDASIWKYLYFAPYHPRRSTKAPLGFRVRPWHELSELERLSAYVPQWGLTSEVEDFPRGLPAALCSEKRLSAISSNLGPKLADVVQTILNRDGLRWEKPVRADLGKLVIAFRVFEREFAKWRRATTNPTDQVVGFLIDGYTQACASTGGEVPSSTDVDRFMQEFLTEQQAPAHSAAAEKALLSAITKCWSLPPLTDNDLTEIVRRARGDRLRNSGPN